MNRKGDNVINFVYTSSAQDGHLRGLSGGVGLFSHAIIVRQVTIGVNTKIIGPNIETRRDFMCRDRMTTIKTKGSEYIISYKPSKSLFAVSNTLVMVLAMHQSIFRARNPPAVKAYYLLCSQKENRAQIADRALGE